MHVPCTLNYIRYVFTIIKYNKSNICMKNEIFIIYFTFSYYNK